MSEHAEKIVNAIAKGNNIEAEDAFKDAMTQNVADALETRKQDVSNLDYKMISEIKFFKNFHVIPALIANIIIT